MGKSRERDLENVVERLQLALQEMDRDLLLKARELETIRQAAKANAHQGTVEVVAWLRNRVDELETALTGAEEVHQTNGDLTVIIAEYRHTIAAMLEAAGRGNDKSVDETMPAMVAVIRELRERAITAEQRLVLVRDMINMFLGKV